MKVLTGGLLGGIILFIWSAISWMFLPWHIMTMHSFTSETAITQAITANAPVSGIYLLPSPQHIAEQAQEPLIFAAVHLQGMPPTMWPSMTAGLISQIIAAFLATWLLVRTSNLSYFGRLGFILVFALAAGIITDIPYWNWFSFPANYTLVVIVDLLIGWFFAGLLIAGITAKT